jgi:DNA-binding protein WhiA
LIKNISFSRSCKNELIKSPCDSGCCAVSELAALIRTAGSIGISREGVYIELTAEGDYVAARTEKLVQAYFGGRTQSVTGRTAHGTELISTVIPAGQAGQILEDCGITERNDVGGLEITEGINNYILMDSCCLAAYIRGAFLGAGYVYIPTQAGDRYSHGYHAEFVFNSDRLASDFSHLLAQLEIFSKKVLRKSKFVVYLKNSVMISEMLARIGAQGSALKIYGEIASRSMRNSINRKANCDNANIDKVVEAASRQREAIGYLMNNGGLEQLSEKLREAAILRHENPDANMAELAAMLEGVGRSGLIHRLNKIIEIYHEQLTEEENNDATGSNGHEERGRS